MTESTDSTVVLGSLREHLKVIPWCKQGEDTLVAVYKCTPEIIEAMKDRPVKCFPGGMQIKSNKSWLSSMQEKFDQELPVPLLLVWRPGGLEMSYRRHKSWEFPYDGWTDPVAAAYEREQVLFESQDFTGDLKGLHQEILSRSKACPAAIPMQ